MKLAIITDIHGNAPALKAVLQEIDQHADIEEIWCLGDMIAMGPDLNEVLDILFARADVQMITGNHDEAILSLNCRRRAPRQLQTHTRAPRMDSQSSQSTTCCQTQNIASNA